MTKFTKKMVLGLSSVSVAALLCGTAEANNPNNSSKSRLTRTISKHMHKKGHMHTHKMDMRKDVETAKGISVTAYGLANVAGRYANTGESHYEASPAGNQHSTGKSGIAFVDNSNAASRIGLKAAKQFRCHEFGAKLEMGLNEFNSSNIDVRNDDANKTSGVNIRHADFHWKMPWGKLSLGKGSTASECLTEGSDLSGTDIVASGPAVQNLGGGVAFNRMLTNASSTSKTDYKSVKVGDTWDSFDGLGRDQRVRYDTPNFAGFVLSAGHVNNGNSDVVLRFSGDFSRFKVDAAVGGYTTRVAHTVNANGIGTNGTNKKTIAGALSVLHTASGVSLTGSFADQNNDKMNNPGQIKEKTTEERVYFRQKNSTMTFVKLGWQKDFFSWGTTAFAVNYGKERNILRDNDITKTVGFTVVQNIKDAGTQLYLTGQQFKHETDIATADKTHLDPSRVTVIALGACIKF
ncbi:MAG: porin [Gammaproteobacteria bacterium]|nr:porin [Gammaproteobacteria bacterium]